MIALELAKLHARIDGDEEDTLLQLLLDGAVEHCRAYLNCPLYADEQERAAGEAAGDTDGVVLNNDIQTAILLTFSWRYAHREDTAERPLAADRLLDKYRKRPGI